MNKVETKNESITKSSTQPAISTISQSTSNPPSQTVVSSASVAQIATTPAPITAASVVSAPKPTDAKNAKPSQAAPTAATTATKPDNTNQVNLYLDPIEAGHG